MMKILKYAALLSLPLAMPAVSAHADPQSIGVHGAYQSECELLLHGDIATLDIAEYRARRNECFGEIKRIDISCHPGTGQHRAHHHNQHEPPAAEHQARVQADEKQKTVDQDRRKTRPSNITRRHRHRR